MDMLIDCGSASRQLLIELFTALMLASSRAVDGALGRCVQSRNPEDATDVHVGHYASRTPFLQAKTPSNMTYLLICPPAQPQEAYWQVIGGGNGSWMCGFDHAEEVMASIISQKHAPYHIGLVVLSEVAVNREEL